MADPSRDDEVAELRRKLEEAEATLDAIRSGEVDAVVVDGARVYTLEGADHPYRALVEAMHQGAVTLSEDGTIFYCNTGVANMIRRPAEKIIGTPIDLWFIPGDREVIRRWIGEGSAVRQVELTLKADDGTTLPVLVSFSRLPLSGLQAVCLVITDLTEQKQNLRLQDSDRRKDEFLAMLAHELRNPIAPIANASSMLRLWNKARHSEVDWGCDVVERQVRHLTRIVDDLLDVSRITRGKIKLEKHLVDVSSIAIAAIETSRPLIESRKHKLHVTIPSEPLTVEADLTRMAQVLTNLLNNAAKYTEEGGEIRLRIDREGKAAVISVCDNGVGIPEEILPRVFDLFTQADRTIDRSQGGLGIGLTLVRSIVELHRGTVSVQSAGAGRGSDFVVRLPLASRTPNTFVGEQKPQALREGICRRILVVDDNVDSANSLALLLRKMGHEAKISHDGPTALETAESFRPALVLLDIGLPGMNGYTVAERMRANPLLRGAVLAALTGYGDEQDRKRSMEVGFDKHFVKPVSMTALQELLGSLCET